MTHLVEILSTSERYLCLNEKGTGIYLRWVRNSLWLPHLHVVIGEGGWSPRGAYNRGSSKRSGIVMKILILKTVFRTACYILYLRAKKIRCGLVETQSVSQILLGFLRAIALAVFSYRCNDPTCFSKSSGSNFSWYDVERLFSSVHLPALVCKNERETVEELSRTLEAHTACSWIDVHNAEVGTERIYTRPKTAGATSLAERQCHETGRARVSGRKEGN